MKKLLALLLLLPLSMLAVSPSYTSFDGTQLVTNGPPSLISIKSGALATNITIVGAFNIVDPTSTNIAVFQYVPGLANITLNSQGLYSGSTLAGLNVIGTNIIASGGFFGNGAGISNVVARGPFTNVTIWTSNAGPAISFNYPTNANAQTWMYYPTTNGVQSWYHYSFPSYFFGHNDQVSLMGYGMGAGGGALIAGQMAVYDQWEPDYYTDATFHQAERHEDWVMTNGVVRRPWMWTGRMDKLLTTMIEGDVLSLYGDASHNTTIIGITSTNVLTFNAGSITADNLTNGFVMQNRVAGGNAWINLSVNNNVNTTSNYINRIFSSGSDNQIVSGLDTNGDTTITTSSNFNISAGPSASVAQLVVGNSSGSFKGAWIKNSNLRSDGSITATLNLTNSGNSFSIGNGRIIGQAAVNNSTTVGSIQFTPTLTSGGSGETAIYETAAGTGNDATQYFHRIRATAGYTGNTHVGLLVENMNAAAGNNVNTDLGSYGVYSYQGAASPLNVALSGVSENATAVGIGTIGRSTKALNSSARIGGLFVANNTGGSPTNVGVIAYIGTMQSVPPMPTNTAAYFDNGTQATPIAAFGTNFGTIRAVVDADGSFKGSGSGLTNIPPAGITGRSYVQTNFVLNTVYAASSGSFTTVAGTAIITAAAAVGNVELDVMYQAGGSGTYTAISAPSLTTTVLSIVMPYQIPFSATITNGNFYLTNATTTAGGSASLKSGTGTLTTF